MDAGGGRLFTRSFLLVCAGTLAFFGSFQLTIPVLPLWVLAVGGSQSDVGLTVGAFSFTSLLVRPFVGREADRLGRKLFVVAGAAIFLVAAVLYVFATSMPLLILLRLFHGSGIACFTTASSTIVADITPPRRRGEAMGYFGMSNTLSLAAAPAIATVLLGSMPMSGIFLVSAGAALVAVLFSTLLPGDRPAAAVREAVPLISRPALFPSVVIACLTASSGAIFTFLPLLATSRNLDVSAVGWFFTTYAASLLVCRPLSGIVSDRWGRAAAIVPGMLSAAIAMVAIAYSFDTPLLLVSAVIWGLAFGTAHPALMAFVVDRVPPSGRGAAMGTFSGAFDLGIGAGAMVWGLLLTYMDFTAVYLMGALVSFAGLLYFLWGSRRPAVAPSAPPPRPASR